MKARKQKFALIMLGVIALSGATLLILNVFQSNIVFFMSPSDVYAKKAPINATFRLGGMVETGSVSRGSDGLTVSFKVTDTLQSIVVHYKGILPDLFREGQGVVVQGKLAGTDFQADQVLAKHDENYMPPEAKAALDQAMKTLKEPQ
jgi:cytochrome c-type biogenesis protein CcmE